MKNTHVNQCYGHRCCCDNHSRDATHVSIKLGVTNQSNYYTPVFIVSDSLRRKEITKIIPIFTLIYSTCLCHTSVCIQLWGANTAARLMQTPYKNRFKIPERDLSVFIRNDIKSTRGPTVRFLTSMWAFESISCRLLRIIEIQER